MLDAEGILDLIEATPEERAAVREAKRRQKARKAWEEEKAQSPDVPRQRRYPGPKAASAFDDDLIKDPVRFVALMEAFRAFPD